jgi:citrate synthase
MITTAIGYTTPDRISVRGHDLANELIGKIDFIDMMMLVILGRRCEGNERDMLNAILVTVTDHGLTPSAIAARLTYTGAPDALQGAVAAGLLGAGSKLLGAMQNAYDMLSEITRELPPEASPEAVREAARELVSRRRQLRLPLAGLGHNIHVNGDPRIPALRAVSERNGYFGRHWQALLAVEAAVTEQRGRLLPINTAGAVGAMVADMGLPGQLARGLSLVGRCAGLVAHLVEEETTPTGLEVWELVLAQDERNVLPGKRR